MQYKRGRQKIVYPSRYVDIRNIGRSSVVQRENIINVLRMFRLMMTIESSSASRKYY
jgi:hypothetical protein